GVAAAGFAPERLVKGYRVSGGDRSILRRRIQNYFFALHITRIRPANSGRHGQQLPQFDVLLPDVIERKRFVDHVVGGEYLRVEPFREAVALLAHQYADSDARVRLATGGQFRRGFSCATSEIALISEKPVPDHE